MSATENAVIARAAHLWDTLTDEQLLAAHLGATFEARLTSLRPENLAFQAALGLGLIDANGEMHELTFKGLELAVRRAWK